jgi:hypothetical protein
MKEARSLAHQDCKSALPQRRTAPAAVHPSSIALAAAAISRAIVKEACSLALCTRHLPHNDR